MGNPRGILPQILRGLTIGIQISLTNQRSQNFKLNQDQANILKIPLAIGTLQNSNNSKIPFQNRV